MLVNLQVLRAHDAVEPERGRHSMQYGKRSGSQVLFEASSEIFLLRGEVVLIAAQ